MPAAQTSTHPSPPPDLQLMEDITPPRQDSQMEAVALKHNGYVVLLNDGE